MMLLRIGAISWDPTQTYTPFVVCGHRRPLVTQDSELRGPLHYYGLCESEEGDVNSDIHSQTRCDGATHELDLPIVKAMPSSMVMSLLFAYGRKKKKGRTINGSAVKTLLILCIF